jgi:murein L,D-transpeptidase YcbB/YkuD
VSRGRIFFADVNPNIDYPAAPFYSRKILDGVASAADSAEFLQALAPPHSAYRALQKKLHELRTDGARVDPIERKHLIDTIAVNLERWRWVPRELGINYIIVNIPAFTLSVIRDGAAIWTTRVVVGDPRTPTPVMSAAIASITFNPTWNVPLSIVAEYMSAVGESSEELDIRRIESVRGPDGRVRYFQPPGQGNALGEIRFNFPNQFAIYQHDTPSKDLFDQNMRAFSHGCMRVEDSITYAELLLGMAAPGGNYRADRIRGLLHSDESTVEFGLPIPVHLTYQTALVDASGALVIHPDIYGYDAKTLELFRRSKPRMAITQAAPTVLRQLKSMTERVLAHIAHNALLLADNSLQQFVAR